MSNAGLVQSKKWTDPEHSRLTANELANLITGRNDGVNRGRIHYWKSKISSARGLAEYRAYPPEVREYLDALLEAKQSHTTTPFHHPRDGAHDRVHRLGKASNTTTAPEPLTASELAWLSALPTDPKQVSFDDARYLAQLAARVDSVNANPGDRRLIEQRWRPVEAEYDRRQAQHALTEKVTEVPNPVAALAALIANDTDELSPAECTFRAEQMMNTAADTLAADVERRHNYARSVIRELDDEAAQRVATTAPTPGPLAHD